MSTPLALPGGPSSVEVGAVLNGYRRVDQPCRNILERTPVLGKPPGQHAVLLFPGPRPTTNGTEGLGAERSRGTYQPVARLPLPEGQLVSVDVVEEDVGHSRPLIALFKGLDGNSSSSQGLDVVIISGHHNQGVTHRQGCVQLVSDEIGADLDVANRVPPAKLLYEPDALVVQPPRNENLHFPARGHRRAVPRAW